MSTASPSPAAAGVSAPVAPGEWTLDSWRSKPISQQPQYADPTQLHHQISIINNLPPLVHQNEVDALKSQLALCARGERFLLQGGDCAERFADCAKAPIEAKLKILLQMSLVLTWGARIPTVRVGRVAGQYGKPRSSPTEKTESGEIIASFKGDNINCFEPTASARTHDPSRLVLAHFHSAATINYIRALIKGGYADLHKSSNWDLGGVRDEMKRSQYQEICRNISDSLEFMETCGISSPETVREVDFFTSHEGLVLEYESAVTKQIDHKYYNLGAHFLWIGNRTRQLDCAHIEYFRGVSNPIGIKVDSGMSSDELLTLLDRLDPHKEPGRITLITRFGSDKIFDHLPRYIHALRQAGRDHCTVWSCDPMHGNTYSTADGVKTRNFDAILAELTNTFLVHEQHGSHLGGVHFELTGEDVTECVGGPQLLSSKDLSKNYTTYCDPRLNYLQSMEMSFLLADLLRKSKAIRRRQSFSEPPVLNENTKAIEQRAYDQAKQAADKLDCE